MKKENHHYRVSYHYQSFYLAEDGTEIEDSLLELKDVKCIIPKAMSSPSQLDLLSSVSLAPMSPTERLSIITPELQHLGDFVLACSTEKVVELKSLLQEVCRKVAEDPTPGTSVYPKS